MAYTYSDAIETFYEYLNINVNDVQIIPDTNSRGIVYKNRNNENCVIFICPISCKQDNKQNWIDTRDSGVKERKVAYSYAQSNDYKYFCLCVNSEQERYRDYIFSLENSEEKISTISYRKKDGHDGTGTQANIPNSYIPSEKFKRFLTPNGFYFAVVSKSDIEDYLIYFDNRPYGLEETLIETNSELNDEILRRWNEKDFRYIENVDDIYKEFQSKFGKEALIHMSNEDCLNKLFGMKDEQGLFYYLQYKYGYFSGIGTLYGGTQRKIYKTIESGNWHVRKDGTKKINVVEIEDAKKEAVEYRNKYVELFEKIENLISKDKLSTKEDYQALATEINNNYKDFNSNWGHKYLHLLFPEYFMPFYNDWWINTTFSIIGEDVLKKYGKKPSKHYYELCQEFCSLAKSLKMKIIYLYHILLAIDGIEDDEYDEEKINLKEKYREWLGKQLKEDGKPYSKGYISNLVGGIENYYPKFHKVGDIENLYEVESLKNYIDAYDEIVNFPGFKEFDDNQAASNTYSATLNLYKKFLTEYFEVGKNVIYYGIPGCGKSYYVEYNILKNVKEKNKYRTTFYLDYSNSDFIGQIYPTVTKEKDTAGNLVSKVKYTKIPGPFTKALERAYRHPEKNIYLVIEEINRGNAAAIFGDLFQLLDRLKDDSKCDDGRVSGDSEYPINNEFIEGYLEDKGVEIPGMDKIYIPHNMFILATMNTSDQNVFPLDTAFKRRWQRERITSDWKDVDERKEMLVPGTHTKWKDFVEKVNAAIVTPTENGILSEDKQIGAFFVSKENLVEEKNYFDMSTSNFVEQQKIKSFLNNVIDYLYNDVTKFDHKQLFNEELKSFEQLYKRVIDEHDTTYGLKCLEE